MPMDSSPSSRIIEGRGEFVAALREILLQACAENCRELYWLDASFVDWPLSDPELLAALTAWARPPRRLHLLAAQYEDLRLRHPRFVQWRVQWGHCVQARAFEADVAAGAGKPALAAAVLASGGERPLSLRLFEGPAWRAAVSTMPADALRTREWFDALAQRSSESFAVTTLGL